MFTTLYALVVTTCLAADKPCRVVEITRHLTGRECVSLSLTEGENYVRKGVGAYIKCVREW